MSFRRPVALAVVIGVVTLLAAASLIGSFSSPNSPPANETNTKSSHDLTGHSTATSTHSESVSSSTTSSSSTESTSTSGATKSETSSVTSTTSSTTSATSSSTSSSTSTTSTQTSIHKVETTGIIIPLYTNYSTSKWGLIIEAKTSNPNVPIVVIVNPHIGPGDHYNSSFAAGVKGMQTAGIAVIGYVWTDYGAKSISSLKAQTLAYSTWYGVDGVLLDGMANSLYDSSGTYMPAYYANLTAYAKSLGMTKVFGNPGADIPAPFIGTVDTMGIFENPFLPSFQFLGGWHTNYNKTNFAFISYNVSSLSSVNASYILGASDYVGYLFFSNITRSHYPTLPPYLSQLAATLAAMTTVTVESVSQSGLSVPGALRASITQPDGSLIAQVTPFTFQVYSGSTVQVSVQDYRGNAFDHWGDGSTGRTITIAVQGPMVFKAYFRP